MIEQKSITELRGIAQAVGLKLDWRWDKSKLIRKIKETTDNALNGVPTESDEPSDARLRTVPPARNLPQNDVMKALEKYKERGLIVTFPTPDSIRLTRTIVREDQCSLRVPLRVIVECARRIVND